MSLATALLVSRAKSGLDVRISGALERVGLSFDDLRLLQTIGQSTPGPSLSVLAGVLDETGSRALRAVRPLEKLGWVDRDSGGNFMLTNSGRTLVDQSEGIAEAAAQRWFADTGTDPAQVTTALAALHSHRAGTI
ncbi:MAG: MarR family winged helix-turn-helix transcriptional regulator [Brevibacterium sp.]|uniref:MarR family winged helix-turn-helix transcriptional regulator n=1 Tax=Brevibacterium sandarakinum TaxID=629680 RepID=UPI00265288E7|nr:MarR family winged helix-turn-helix transcriptional regulator [Brevibacterium sandarakinum]MDN5585077.1 MarR family winged helix-turn-helix transcriptional regulator [Brevibacterium sp.]MDN5634035.1 MarR family winged helix-turn-helix transcriptional regulator [Brevibacterium sp.]MDN5656915.1 MarR family winged helix-turn-helix transcriptional regulator [Brevibacterium sandarakinum]